MPKQSKDAHEQTEDTMARMVEETLKGVLPYPVVFCGVNRKINIGNFENIDVYSGVALPITAFPGEDMEAFQEALAEANEMGFAVVSRETGQRYKHIKEMQGER